MYFSEMWPQKRRENPSYCPRFDSVRTARGTDLTTPPPADAHARGQTVPFPQAHKLDEDGEHAAKLL